MTSVGEVMTARPVTVSPDDAVTKARSIMRKRGFRSLPVMSDDYELVGVISRGDVMKVTSTRTNLRVDGVMEKNILSVKSTDDIREAIKIMVSGSVRQLPVVDDQLVGVVTSLDVLKTLTHQDREPRRKTVDEVMTSKVVYCSPDDDFAGVWDKMADGSYSGLPVVGKTGVAGFITRGDAIKHGSFRLSREGGKTKSVLVKKVMHSPAVTIKPGSGVKDAGVLMVERNIIRLPVVGDKNTLSGIVDVEDVLGAYA